MEITLERAGVFNASRSMISNEHKCASMRTKIYGYHVRIKASDKRLTPEGFLLNNELVQVYFDKKWGRLAKPWEAVSCELLALTSAKDLCELCSKQVDVIVVYVGIKGSNGAWLTAECRPADLREE